MAAIPNLNTLRTGRGGPRRRGARGRPDGGQPPEDVDVDAGRDRVIQQTDHDASSSRMSAVSLGYLDDAYAQILFPPGAEVPRRYPIINRGTYVRTRAIDHLVTRFLAADPSQKKQIVSLGAGSDTRFLRFWSDGRFLSAGVEYHELDFEANVDTKRTVLRGNRQLSETIHQAEKAGSRYHLHALDLRDLTSKSPPTIPNLDNELPTLLISECCLCYLPPDATSSILQYFTMSIKAPMALILYEPIRPFDAFGRTMVTNLASRGIHLQTLQRYATLEAQRQRLQLAALVDGQGARDVHQLWMTDAWTSISERERVERLEWLDEVEEWQLLASHYCVAWGWRGEVFGRAWADLDGSRTPEEHKEIDMS